MKNNKNLLPEGNFKKLILHFNIDKTIIIRDSLKYNNPEYTVNKLLNNILVKRNFFKFNLGKSRKEWERRRKV